MTDHFSLSWYLCSWGCGGLGGGMDLSGGLRGGIGLGGGGGGLEGFGGLRLITSFAGSFDCRGQGTGLGLEFK